MARCSVIQVVCNFCSYFVIDVIWTLVETRWFLVGSSAGVCTLLVWEQVDDLFSLQIASLFECGGDYLSTYFACRCL